jgi:homoserine O-succinyltransferase/O-acetyltransferase
MPLYIDPPGTPGVRNREARKGLVIGLVNNMPDAALESTEAQFTRLLSEASGGLPLALRIGYLPEVPRGPEALGFLTRTYWHVDQLTAAPLDALIVTGLEPKAANLVDEPYWSRLAALLEWAQASTASSIWSCLAAHAAVQQLDGIMRRRLDHKRFGVFEHSLLERHPMIAGVAAPLCLPHSRWNELPVQELRGAGYTLLSGAPETGADIFLKRTRSLLVFLQGHPEYEPATLLKEYRRDVGRFLRGQQPHYPMQPKGYFSAAAAAQLDAFEQRARAERTEETLAAFPTLGADAYRGDRWGAAAARIYRNWLALVASERLTTGTYVSL